MLAVLERNCSYLLSNVIFQDTSSHNVARIRLNSQHEVLDQQRVHIRIGGDWLRTNTKNKHGAQQDFPNHLQFMAFEHPRGELWPMVEGALPYINLLAAHSTRDALLLCANASDLKDCGKDFGGAPLGEDAKEDGDESSPDIEKLKALDKDCADRLPGSLEARATYYWLRVFEENAASRED